MTNKPNNNDWSDPDLSLFGPDTTPEEREQYKKHLPVGGSLTTVFIVLGIILFLLNTFSSCGG